MSENRLGGETKRIDKDYFDLEDLEFIRLSWNEIRADEGLLTKDKNA